MNETRNTPDEKGQRVPLGLRVNRDIKRALKSAAPQAGYKSMEGFLNDILAERLDRPDLMVGPTYSAAS